MAQIANIGKYAPNFDLRSTEDVVLMLVDEAPRAAQVLYFFDDPADETRRSELSELSRRVPAIRAAGGGLMAISPAGIDDLKAVQKELGLAFPLLRDDRGFRKAYGVGDEEAEFTPALFVVDRDCRIAWADASAISRLDEAVTALAGLGGSERASYPKSVLNRLVQHFAG